MAAVVTSGPAAVVSGSSGAPEVTEAVGTELSELDEAPTDGGLVVFMAARVSDPENEANRSPSESSSGGRTALLA